jgi:AbrB family looped-hinge helix DNA binding protein
MVETLVKWHIMNTIVTIDQAGRVGLPKPLRDELRWEAGDTLQLESEGERVTLRPIRSKSSLRKERGIWVFQGGGTLSVSRADEMIADAREGRRLRA